MITDGKDSLEENRCVCIVDLQREELVWKSPNFQFGDKETVFVDEKDIEHFVFNNDGLTVEFVSDTKLLQNFQKFPDAVYDSSKTLVTKKKVLLGICDGRFLKIYADMTTQEKERLKRYFDKGVDCFTFLDGYAIVRLKNKQSMYYYKEKMERDGFFGFYVKKNTIVIDVKSFGAKAPG